jgi:hypothetical protein
MSKDEIIQLGWKWEQHFNEAKGYGDYVAPETECFSARIGDKDFWLVWYSKDGVAVVTRVNMEPQTHPWGSGHYNNKEELRAFMKQVEAYPQSYDSFNIGVDGFMKKTI